jgi:hypothetical protein
MERFNRIFQKSTENTTYELFNEMTMLAKLVIIPSTMGNAKIIVA